MAITTTRSVFPKIPDAPREYTKSLFDGIVNALRISFDLIQAVGPIFCTTINASSLPTTGYNQINGTVFCNPTSGALYVVLANVGYAPSFAATAALGTVTVTTT